MFVQTIRGKTSDRQGIRACLDRWLKDLEPGATGWLGRRTCMPWMPCLVWSAGERLPSLKPPRC
jgi:hypothetical protein